MSALSLVEWLRSARVQLIADALNSGAGAGKFLFYTAPRPAAGAALTTQVLLGTLVLQEPCGTVDAGVLTFAPISDDQLADADGIAVWVRALDGDNAWVLDMDVTDALGPGPVKMNTTQVYQHGILRITSAVLVEGNL